MSLPSTYKQVEYIESTGTQYINTGFSPSNKTKVVCRLSADNVMYGSGVNGQYQALSLMNYNGYYTGRFKTTSYSNQTIQSTVPVGTVHDFENSQIDGFYIDGTKIGSYTQYTFTESRPVYLFTWNGTGGNPPSTPYTSGTLYYLKIYENGTLVRDFVPCYRKSDSVIGLYDLVNNTFYTNAGTGTFTKGPDVRPAGENEMVNAYIGSGVLYEHSFDLRGKTAAQIQADGWTIGSKNSVGYNLNANGLGNLASGDTSAWIVRQLPVTITENNKITFTMGSYGGSTASYAGMISCGLAAGTAIDAGTSSSGQMRIINASGSSVNYNVQLFMTTVGNVISGTSSYGSGAGFLTCVIDFPNNTITYNKTSPVSYSTTHTMTTAERNEILSYKNYRYAKATTYSSATTNYIQTVSIKIE